MSNGDGGNPPTKQDTTQNYNLSPTVVAILRARGLQVPDAPTQEVPTNMSPRVQQILQLRATGQLPGDTGPGGILNFIKRVFSVTSAVDQSSMQDPRHFPTTPQGSVEKSALMGQATLSGVVKPVLNAAELAPELLRHTEWGKKYAGGMFNFTLGVKGELDGSERALVQQAKRAGVSDRAIRASAGLGHFLGFTIPLEGSIRLAGLAFGGAEAITPQLFTRDFLGGLIYGAGMEPGSITKRLKQGAEQGAAFLAFGAILSGAGSALQGYRNSRAFKLAKNLEVKNQLKDLAKTVDPLTGVSTLSEIEPLSGRTLGELLSEENYISSSPGALQLIQRNADTRALIQGISDLSETGTSVGLVRSVGEATDVLPGMRSTFPGMTFTPIKRSEGNYDVLFSVKGGGLSGKKLAQFKREGFFEDQTVVSGGSMYKYVGPSKNTDYVVVQPREGGKNFTIKKEYVKPYAYGEPPIERTPENDFLGDEFYKWYEHKQRQEMYARENEMSRTQMLTEALKGNLVAEEFANRDFTAGDALLHPGSAGLGADGLPMDRPTAKFENDPSQLMVYSNNQPIGVIGVHDGTKPGEVLVSEALSQTGKPLTLTRSEMAGLLEDVRGQLGGNVKSVRFTGTERPEMLRPLDTESMVRLEKRIGDMSALAEQGKLSPEHMAQLERLVRERELRRGPLVSRSPDEELRVSGTENVAILHPEPALDFETIAARFLHETGLENTIDSRAAIAYLGQNIRQRIMREVPREDVQILQNLRTDAERIINESKETLGRSAAMSGFSVNRGAEGRIQLRDINSGVPYGFENSDAAFEFLKGVERNFLDEGTRSGIPLPSGGLSPAHNEGLDTPDTWSIFPEEGLTGAFKALPASATRPLPEFLKAIEERTGMPFWSDLFAEMDERTQKMNNALLGWDKEIDDIFGLGKAKGLKREALRDIGMWTREAEKADIDQFSREGMKIASDMGLSDKQVKAAKRMRALWDLGFQQAGLPSGSYIRSYFGRIQPFAEKYGTIDMKLIFPGGIPKDVDAFYKHMRIGDPSHVELNPAIVMRKWFRALEFERNVGPAWDRLWSLTQPSNPLGLNSLEASQRRQATAALGGADAVEHIREILAEYAHHIRGMPDAGLRTTRRVTSRIMEKLGIEGSDRLGEELTNAYMSSMYGSAIGLRPRLLSRNATQNIWFSWTRLGGKHAGDAIHTALSMDGFFKAANAGAIRQLEKGIPFGNIFSDEILSQDMLHGTGPLSNVTASVIRGMVRAGKVSRNAASKFLVPYSSVDDVNRAVAFWWQRLHTKEWLGKFQRGDVTAQAFLDSGLPFFSPVVKKEFMERLKLGEDKALDFIGKQAADENHFIYGASAQPAWMQGTFTKFFGMFGTWPIWAKEMYLHRMRYGTGAQKLGLVLRTMAATTAIGVTGAEVGIHLWNWMAPTSVGTWFGGPVVQYLADAQNLVTGFPGNRTEAAHRLAQDMGRLSLPGQGFYRDVMQTLEYSQSAVDAALLMGLGRTDLVKKNWGFELMNNEELMRELDGMPPPVRATPENVQEGRRQRIERLLERVQ